MTLSYKESLTKNNREEQRTGEFIEKYLLKRSELNIFHEKLECDARYCNGFSITRKCCPYQQQQQQHFDYDNNNKQQYSQTQCFALAQHY